MKQVLLGLLIMCGMIALAGSAQVQGEEEEKRGERRELLKNDFLIHSTPFVENTAKVVPPSPGCPQGKIVVNTGGPARLLHRPLYYDTRKHASAYYDELRHIDTTSPTAEVTYPTGPTKAVHTDNQLVRLSDGSLLALKNSSIWDPIEQNPPAWINERVTTEGGDHKGLRAGVLLFRSTDCGNSWTLYSTIDFGTFLNGKYGVPRPLGDNGKIVGEDPDTKVQGKYPDDNSLKWWEGGGDRTEIYVCPFTGFVYLTTRIISGPYLDIIPNKLDQELLLYSKDNGETWELIKDDLPGWSPIVMTSTPNGRLFLFHSIRSQPTVYFSKMPVTSGQKPEISQGYPVYYVKDGVNLPHTTSLDVDIFFQLDHPSISRISTDGTSSKVRAAYHSVNSSGMQETPVITIDVQDPHSSPAVEPVQVISAHDPEDYSVLYFNFIDPDYIDLPVDIPSNTSVAYWIEVPRTGLADKRYAIRYTVFEDDFNTSCPAYLSVQNGKPRTWSTRQDLGDYMTGGFFWTNNTLNYLAQWVEPTGIWANIVTRPYHHRPGGDSKYIREVLCQSASHKFLKR